MLVRIPPTPPAGVPTPTFPAGALTTATPTFAGLGTPLPKPTAPFLYPGAGRVCLRFCTPLLAPLFGPLVEHFVFVFLSVLVCVVCCWCNYNNNLPTTVGSRYKKNISSLSYTSKTKLYLSRCCSLR